MTTIFIKEKHDFFSYQRIISLGFFLSFNTQMSEKDFYLILQTEVLSNSVEVKSLDFTSFI
jgi:hypothetical protein